MDNIHYNLRNRAIYQTRFNEAKNKHLSALSINNQNRKYKNAINYQINSIPQKTDKILKNHTISTCPNLKRKATTKNLINNKKQKKTESKIYNSNHHINTKEKYTNTGLCKSSLWGLRSLKTQQNSASEQQSTSQSGQSTLNGKNNFISNINKKNKKLLPAEAIKIKNNSFLHKKVNFKLAKHLNKVDLKSQVRLTKSSTISKEVDQINKITTLQSSVSSNKKPPLADKLKTVFKIDTKESIAQNQPSHSNPNPIISRDDIRQNTVKDGRNHNKRKRFNPPHTTNNNSICKISKISDTITKMAMPYDKSTSKKTSLSSKKDDHGTILDVTDTDKSIATEKCTKKSSDKIGYTKEDKEEKGSEKEDNFCCKVEHVSDMEVSSSNTCSFKSLSNHSLLDKHISEIDEIINVRSVDHNHYHKSNSNKMGSVKKMEMKQPGTSSSGQLPDKYKPSRYSSDSEDFEDNVHDIGKLHNLLETKGLSTHHLLNALGPRMQQLIQKTLGTTSTKANSKIHKLVEDLKNKDLENYSKLASCQEICKILLMSQEDSLANFPVHSCVKALVHILKGENHSDFELMNEACKALTYMMESIPRSISLVSTEGTIIFLNKVREIQCIDVAEQSLTALKMLSRKHAKTILLKGGISSCLAFVDFYSAPARRSAFSVAASCCEYVTGAESFRVNVIGSLRLVEGGLTTGQDKSVIESCCLCYCRLIEVFRDQPILLEQIATFEYISNIVNLLMASPPIVDSKTSSMIIKSLHTMIKGCNSLAVILLKNDIIDTLKYLLMEEQPPTTESPTKSKINDVFFSLQNVISPLKDLGFCRKNPMEISEITLLICELFPSLNSHHLSLSDRLFYHEHKNPEIFSKFHESSEYTKFTCRDTSPKNGGLAPQIPKLQSITSEDSRKCYLDSEEGREIGKYFVRSLMPLVYRIYDNSPGNVVKYNCLKALLRMLYHSKDDGLVLEILSSLDISNYIVSMLTSKDLKIILSALQMIELLLSKFPQIFITSFKREGVQHKITELVHTHRKSIPTTNKSIPTNNQFVDSVDNASKVVGKYTSNYERRKITNAKSLKINDKSIDAPPVNDKSLDIRREGLWSYFAPKNSDHLNIEIGGKGPEKISHSGNFRGNNAIGMTDVLLPFRKAFQKRLFPLGKDTETRHYSDNNKKDSNAKDLCPKDQLIPYQNANWLGKNSAYPNDLASFLLYNANQNFLSRTSRLDYHATTATDISMNRMHLQSLLKDKEMPYSSSKLLFRPFTPLPLLPYPSLLSSTALSRTQNSEKYLNIQPGSLSAIKKNRNDVKSFKNNRNEGAKIERINEVKEANFLDKYFSRSHKKHKDDKSEDESFSNKHLVKIDNKSTKNSQAEFNYDPRNAVFFKSVKARRGSSDREAYFDKYLLQHHNDKCGDNERGNVVNEYRRLKNMYEELGQKTKVVDLELNANFDSLTELKEHEFTLRQDDIRQKDLLFDNPEESKLKNFSLWVLLKADRLLKTHFAPLTFLDSSNSKINTDDHDLSSNNNDTLTTLSNLCSKLSGLFSQMKEESEEKTILLPSRLSGILEILFDIKNIIVSAASPFEMVQARFASTILGLLMLNHDDPDSLNGIKNENFETNFGKNGLGNADFTFRLKILAHIFGNAPHPNYIHTDADKMLFLDVFPLISNIQPNAATNPGLSPFAILVNKLQSCLNQTEQFPDELVFPPSQTNKYKSQYSRSRFSSSKNYFRNEKPIIKREDAFSVYLITQTERSKHKIEPLTTFISIKAYLAKSHYDEFEYDISPKNEVNNQGNDPENSNDFNSRPKSRYNITPRNNRKEEKNDKTHMKISSSKNIEYSKNKPLNKTHYSNDDIEAKSLKKKENLWKNKDLHEIVQKSEASKNDMKNRLRNNEKTPKTSIKVDTNRKPYDGSVRIESLSIEDDIKNQKEESSKKSGPYNFQNLEDLRLEMAFSVVDLADGLSERWGNKIEKGEWNEITEKKPEKERKKNDEKSSKLRKSVEKRVERKSEWIEIPHQWLMKHESDNNIGVIEGAINLIPKIDKGTLDNRELAIWNQILIQYNDVRNGTSIAKHQSLLNSNYELLLRYQFGPNSKYGVTKMTDYKNGKNVGKNLENLDSVIKWRKPRLTNSKEIMERHFYSVKHSRALDLLPLQDAKLLLNNTNLLNKDPSIPVIRFLKILRELNKYWGSLYEALYYEPFMPDAEFVNRKLTAKIDRILRDPLILLDRRVVPGWIGDMAYNCPFLLSFPARLAIFNSLTFNTERALLRLQDREPERFKEILKYFSTHIPSSSSSFYSYLDNSYRYKSQRNGNIGMYESSESLVEHALSRSDTNFVQGEGEEEIYDDVSTALIPGENSNNNMMLMDEMDGIEHLVRRLENSIDYINTGLFGLDTDVRKKKFTLHRTSSFLSQAFKNNIFWPGLARLSVFEFSFDSEPGTGLGPTLEFYSLVSQEIRELKNVWRSQDQYSNAPLFPNPHPCLTANHYHLSKTSNKFAKIPSKISAKSLKIEKEYQDIDEKFEFLGKFMAKSLLDCKLIDLPLSPLFFRNLFILNEQPEVEKFFDGSANNGSLGSEQEYYDLILSKDYPNEFPTPYPEGAYIDFNFKNIDFYYPSELNIMDTGLAKSFAHIKTTVRTANADPETSKNLDLDFTLPGFSYDLIKQGHEIVLDEFNVKAYLRLLLHHGMFYSVLPQAKSFLTGFNSIMDFSSLSCFYPEELNSLFCGDDYDNTVSTSTFKLSELPNIYWSYESILNSIKPDHGYTPEHRIIKELAQILSEFNGHHRRCFLRFLTGCPRLPIGGFKNLCPPLTVVRKTTENLKNDSFHSNSNSLNIPRSKVPSPVSLKSNNVINPQPSDVEEKKSDSYLPSVMTCVNYLKMPEYSNRAIMEERLKFAITEGSLCFHLS
ncbi:uncharacterized protein LOC135927131 isoform X3 [Gordionus sp. m RMFG-2023]|uniref:uncharacterized protein LOC135927131 isoform X3 n=1 Tax=Gordionus sp. m RMFG-2023 TaxID=3053472 RepID=UPI0031FCAD00